MLPTAFIEHLRPMLGDATNDFIHALDRPPVISLRLHPLKAAICPPPALSPIPWTDYGFYLSDRPFFTGDPAFYAGGYYVQEASSMFLEQVIRQVVTDTDTPLLALDLCAAPGGKTTHLSSLLPPDSWLIANEPVSQRVAALSENVQKWGMGNTMVIQNQPEEIARLYPDTFDLVLVDAPCSGEGLFRKMPDIAQQWSLRQVEGCALRQQSILQSAWQTLRQGGYLVYSTCTFNRLENEAQLLQLAADNADCCPLRLSVPLHWGVSEREENGVYTYRFFPHHTHGEGFAITIVQKTGDRDAPPRPAPKSKSATRPPRGWDTAPAVPLPFEDARTALWLQPNGMIAALPRLWLPLLAPALQQLRVHYSGLVIGEPTRKDFKPAPALALWTGLPAAAADWIQYWDTDYPTAAALLTLQTPPPPPHLHDGWILCTYRGWRMGWCKKVGNRLNNYFNKDWRILAAMDTLLQSEQVQGIQSIV